jgi:hypothetical protein
MGRPRPQLTADGWYVVETSGCSCPSYDENARVEVGPFDSIEHALIAWLPERFNGLARAYYGKQTKAVFTAALEYQEK